MITFFREYDNRIIGIYRPLLQYMMPAYLRIPAIRNVSMWLKMEIGYTLDISQARHVPDERGRDSIVRLLKIRSMCVSILFVVK
jgi:hypothetical protein